MIFTDDTWVGMLHALIDLDKVQSIYFRTQVARSILPIWDEKFPKNDELRLAIKSAEDGTSSPSPNSMFCWDQRTDLVGYRLAVLAYHTASVVHSDSDAAWVAYYAVHTARDKDEKLKWVSRLYSSIKKKQLFPQSWKTRDAINVAKSILSLKDFKDMPILADALEDAGCTDAEILYHLRNDEGLWTPVDWVLVNLGE